MHDLIEANKALQNERESLVEELEKLRNLTLSSEAGSSGDNSNVSSPPQADLPPGIVIPPKDNALLSMFRADGAPAPAGVWPLEKVTLAQNTKQLTSFIAPDLAVPHMSLKQFIAAALKLAMENLIVTDPNRLGHPIVYASQGFQSMTGYTKEEILGRNCRFLQGRGTDSQAITNIGQAIREGREYLTEVLNYRKDGTPFWNLVYITPVEDQAGRTTNYIGVQFDITASKPSNLVSMVSGALNQSPRVELLGGASSAGAEQVKTEDATSAYQPSKKQRDTGDRQHKTTESAPNQGLKNLLASILHLSMSNLIVSDPRLPDNPVVYASEGFQKLTGYSREEIVGRNCRFLQGPGTDEKTVRAIREGLRQKTPFLAEILNYRKDGTPFWNLLFITPVLDPQGQPFKYIGVSWT
uniref:Putative LOV domain-containing protein n=1 Tax=Cyanophora paradoxa TaxID=2762 RepID=A0A126X0W9_CYAPA|nr:putative LOV domain-containing protein [Cyanophora paradoxa]